MAIGEALMTLEEYMNLPDDGRILELVRGRIVELPRPNQRHGQLCYRASKIIGNFVDDNDLGHILMNDSGIITERDPDTLRGPDLAFYRFEKLPRGPLPGGYPKVPPDLVIEVRSPSDRWREVQAKVNEFLQMGVLVVCVLDPDSSSISVFSQDRPPRTLGPEQELSIPECLGEFRVVIGKFFD